MVSTEIFPISGSTSIFYVSTVPSFFEAHGAFIRIHVSTPLKVCETRDMKGPYAKVRKRIIP
ncbi:MAG: adenylyl-sulfate kinase [Deltaproteobacteria bacterium]|nr:adenylyl-sulfate kinase [Deltaproteobacteria bacterium]MBW2564844.1 adenylyl-sulfate kinase [Deltaproteobacteria bacterium]